MVMRTKPIKHTTLHKF